MEQPENKQDNANKCYNCGKNFRAPALLERHKNRKTPCLIQELDVKDINNPNRCIYCNKIFSKKSNLTTHLKTCKIKNGGMNVLADKVRYEQELRIIIERNKLLEDRVEKLEAERAVGQQININNTQINVQNITINNFLKPNLDHLFIRGDLQNSLFTKLLKENLVMTPTALVPVLWFNPDKPDNLSVSLVDNVTGLVLVHDGDVWLNCTRDDIVTALRNRAYEITEKLLASSEPLRNMVPLYITDNISRNRTDTEVMKIEKERVYAYILDGRGLIDPKSLPKNCKKLKLPTT